MFASATAAAGWRESLNPAQLEAVTCGDGPVLVIAGAGTGKTWTLACRVAHLIEQGTPPERILLLTFSRRASREMLSRADRLIQRKGTVGKVWGGTFHAIANRLLRLYGRPLGLSPDFTVLDQADMADLMDLIRGEQHPARDKHERRFPRKDTLVAIYSRMVNAGQPLSVVLESAYPWCQDDAEGIRAIFAEYTRRKRAQNVLDYDDLLLFWRALGRSAAGRTAARQFDHVLVDEYQDTNPLQAEILQSLRAENRNLMVVGDDAQSIYAFRAASVRNILDFPSQFPGARRITLEQNYRSTRPILDVSNAVISYARERFPKDLWPVRPGGARPVLLTCSDESEQSVQVCEQVLEHREQGTPLRQQAVLFRSGHHSDMLELELTRRNIPFVKYGGLKFLESAHIKDVLAVLRILENPRDEVSWFRALQLLEGIGPAGARSIMHAIGVSNQRPRSVRALSSGHGSSSTPLSAGHPPSVTALSGRGESSATAIPTPSVGGRVVPPPTDFVAVSGPSQDLARPAAPLMDSGGGASTRPRSDSPGAADEAELHSADGPQTDANNRNVSHDSARALPVLPAATEPLDAVVSDPLRRFIEFPPSVAEAARVPLAGLRDAFADCLSPGATLSPAAEISRIRRFCEPIFQQRYSSPQARLQDIEQLEQVAGAHSSRGRFLSDLALDPPNSTSDLAGPPLLDEDYLILSTVHSAKGGEWDVVHVIHAADGMIPSDMATGDKEAIEEERRLFYVALTRARDSLYLYFCLRYYRRPGGQDDAHHFAQITRFLPEPVQALFDRRFAGSLIEPAATGAHPSARGAVDALLSALWDA